MSDKLSTQPYRGTRDFLPEEMSVRRQVFARLYEVIESFGYLRYDGPVLEPVEIYEAKTSQEIVDEQLYTLTDKKGRRLALRPEMTPSVARMIAANARRLTFPARWYSHVNCHRYERPQRGRVREHWQINVDVFGSESVEAEIEIFELIAAMMRALGAADGDWVLRVSDRTLVEGALALRAGVPPERMRAVLGVLDRWDKVPLEASRAALSELELSPAGIECVEEVRAADLERLCELAPEEAARRSAVARIRRDALTDAPFEFDPRVVRAFEYYTSTVFEVFDTDPENRRSLYGGGRYDNLVGLFTKDRVPGVGFAMGDVTLMDFLATHGVAPQPRTHADARVLALEPAQRPEARRLAQELRSAGLVVETTLEPRPLSKELKAAHRAGVELAVILGPDELAAGTAVLRNMRRSEQRAVPRAELCAAVRAELDGSALPAGS